MHSVQASTWLLCLGQARVRAGYGRTMTRRLIPSSAVVTLTGLAILGIVATVLSVERAVSDARERDRQAVRLAAERVSSDLLNAMSSLRGVDVLAADGVVTQQEVTAFAADVVPGSEFTALAFAEPVSDAERAAWETAVGSPIVDSDGAGGFAPAAARTEHVAVRYVAPRNETSSRVVGLDFNGDPVRSQAVDEALVAVEPVVIGPSPLASSGGIGLFVINAVRTDDAEVVGYIAGGISADTVLQAGLEVDDIEQLGLAIDGTTVVAADGSVAAVFDLGGTTLAVNGTTSIGPNLLLPSVIGLGTVALWGGAFATGRRQRRERDRQRWISLRNARLADLAEQLAAAPDAGSVIAAAVDVAGRVIGADHTAVGTRDPVDRSKLIVYDDLTSADGSVGQPRVLGVHEPLPLTACVDRATAMVLPDHDTSARLFPDAAPMLRRASIQGQVCVPLSLGSEESAGAVGFMFRTAIPSDRLDDVVDSARSVAQLVGRALERARVREVVQGGIDLLGDLSRQLAAARTRDDIAAAVDDVVPHLLGVEAAHIVAVADHDPTSAVRRYRLQQGGDVELEVILGRHSGWNATYESLTRGIVDLIDGAWSRAELYDHGRSVLQRLQESLLSEPPTIPGFEIAVGYRSAIEAVGIGGDWYSVIDDGTTLHAIIGDIAGHGPGAVALMAEVKTILRYLLSTGSSIVEAAERASVALERRNAFASAVLVSIDRRREELAYLNAGHPPPLLLRGDATVDLLDHVHRPWLGVASGPATPTVVGFEPGSTLLLYTDGLIEERGEHFDVSVDRLRVAVRGAHDPQELTERLLHDRSTNRTACSIDDDVALTAIARLGG